MVNFDEFKTEVIGISAEVAIADYYNIPVNENYRKRGADVIIEQITPILGDVFKNIPTPSEHIAEDQNPTDFLLENSSSLSVKTNKKKLGKVAPQIIGQPTSDTYFQHFSDLLQEDIPVSYSDKAKLFKKFSIENIDLVLERYWKNLFHCDYLVYIFDVLDKNGELNEKPNYLSLSRINPINWEKDKFTFTQSLESWNESNTVKYKGISIGEFQVHNNRDCFKFRFLMNNILKLIELENK